MSSDETNQDLMTEKKNRDPLVGTTLDGRFRVEELIGSGGMSNVYRATQLRVNRDVAIKTLKVQVDQPIYRERFQREIDLLCALSHPNIVTVYDCLLGPNDEPCVVMDYLRGRSLEQLLIDEGPLAPDRFARIFVQVLGALDHAHRKGVVHRDIKPGNIVMLDRETDFIKVVDFGLAKFNQESRRLTHTGELWGSPPYMSPEQCMGKPDSERSDLYSVGVVMYEMITGKDPYFHATSIFELIQCHVNTPPPTLLKINPMLNVPPRLEEILFKAMAKDPADRHQSANELKDDIVAACLSAADSLSVSSGSYGTSPPSYSDASSYGGLDGTGSGGGKPAGDSIWISKPSGIGSGANAADGTANSTAFGSQPQAHGIASGEEAQSGGTPSTTSGASANEAQPKAASGNLSPWSREGAARAQATGGTGNLNRWAKDSSNNQSGAFNQPESRPTESGGSFGSVQQLEECTVCGKPIQKQRRGSMTSWILADHHKVMEKISGACMCMHGGEPSGEHQKVSQTPQRAENVGDTGMQMAKLLARQGMPQSIDERSTTSNSTTGQQKPELFEDPRASMKSSMRFTADTKTSNALLGNQIVTVIVTVVVIAGLICGGIQAMSGMHPQTASTPSSTASPPEASSEATLTGDNAHASDSKKKPADSAQKADTPKKAPTRKASPKATHKPKSPSQGHSKSAKAEKPAAKPSIKPATGADRWDLLRK